MEKIALETVQWSSLPDIDEVPPLEDADYSVTIRCLTDYNLVFFIVAHPNTDFASQELRLMLDDF